MGHLIFAGLFVFLVVILVGKIYFSYIYSAKREKDDNTEVSVEIGEQGKWFYVQKWIALVAGILVFLVPFFLIYFFKLLREEPQHSDALWMLIDLLILGFFVFILLIIKCVRSYIHIRNEGFEYRQAFRTKAYSKEEIEYVCRTTEFIFIKRKNCRMPVVIETIYANNDCLYGMLCSLQSLIVNSPRCK